jgi:hypothetical protein
MTMPRTRQLVLFLPALLAFACSSPQIGNLTGDPLNPELYRAQIVAIDAVLFEDGPLGADGRDQVGSALVELAGFAESDATNTIATQLGKEMRTLASMTTRTTVGTPLAGSALRRQWLRIRSSLFNDAAWFRRSSADPIEPVVAGPPPPSALRPATAQERAGLDQALRSIGDLIDRAKQDLPNANDSDLRRQFAADAQRELALDGEGLGDPPPVYGVDISYRRAHGEATEAIRNLRTLTGLGVGAPTSSREYLISKAQEHLDKALAAAAQMMPAR